MRVAAWLGVLLLTCVVSSAQPVPSVRVRVYDYTGIEPQMLKAAQGEAAARLADAGMSVEWIACRFRARPLKNEACDRPFTPADFILNLLPRRMAQHFAQPRNALAIAAVSGEPRADREFWVFYDAIRALGEEQASTATILGSVVAHELAHLLFDSVQHADSGIMRGTWSPDLLRDAACGRLRFTSEAVDGMREGLHRRWLRSGDQQPPDQQAGGK
jgi:hypothetical protein